MIRRKAREELNRSIRNKANLLQKAGDANFNLCLDRATGMASTGLFALKAIVASMPDE